MNRTTIDFINKITDIENLFLNESFVLSGSKCIIRNRLNSRCITKMYIKSIQQLLLLENEITDDNELYKDSMSNTLIIYIQFTKVKLAMYTFFPLIIVRQHYLELDRAIVNWLESIEDAKNINNYKMSIITISTIIRNIITMNYN